MAVDFNDLLDPPTADEIEQRLLDLAEENELPTTGWGPGSWIPTVIKIFAVVLEDLWRAVTAISQSGVLEISPGRWLDLLAESQFQERRKNPTFTAGTFRLTDAGGGPHNVLAGQCTVSSVGGLKFRNVANFTIPASGYVEATFYAEAVGEAYNLPNDSTLSLVTALPTVTVTNPAIGSTWITGALGTDAESPEALRKRLALKWATLSTGSPAAAYENKALGITGVSRVKVDDANPDGPGSVRVLVDNPSTVATLQTLLDAFRPIGTKATAYAATTQAVTIPGVVTVQRAYRATAEAEVNANLAALALSTPIGGIVRESELIEQIMRPAGVVDFAMASSWTGSPNLQLGSTSYPQISLALTFVEV